jgi:hypothetical protein
MDVMYRQFAEFFFPFSKTEKFVGEKNGKERTKTGHYYGVEHQGCQIFLGT